MMPPPTTYDYSAFGLSLPSKSQAISQRYGFTGREGLAAAPLLYYRWRVYDPGVGRFAGRDPVGYPAGPHLYSYGHARPTLVGDPFGEHIYHPPSHVGAPWSERRLPRPAVGLTATYWDDGRFRWEVQCYCYCALEVGWRVHCANKVDMHIYVDPRPGGGIPLPRRYGHEQRHLRNMLTAARAFEATVDRCADRFNRRDERWRTEENCVLHATRNERTLTEQFRSHGRRRYLKEGQHADGNPAAGTGYDPDGAMPAATDDPLVKPQPIVLQ